MNVCRFGLAVLGFFSHFLQAQDIKKPDQYEVETGAYTAAKNRTPFWLQTNQFGIVPTTTPILTVRTALRADYDTTRINNRKLDYGYGIRLVGNFASEQGGLRMPELYAKVRYRAVELSVGRRQDILGLGDSTLSSGSYSWSGNAFPIPKIQLAIPQFTPLPFTRGWVSVMGTFAHGYLNATGFVNHSMLHQKSLYVRVGRVANTVRLYGGFVHQAVWGGEIADLSLINNNDIAREKQLPSRFRDYFYVATGLRLPGSDNNRLTNFDYTNRIGNHLGQVDLGADIDLVRYNLFLYRQSVFDDGSLYYLLNIADGLNGVRLRRNNPDALVRDVLVEYLNTTSQGGSVFVIDDPMRRGRDDYFNHSQFRDGWSYRQRGLGTPFITPALGRAGQWPFGTFTDNNRVRVFHVGLAGSLPTRGWFVFSDRVQYQAKISVSRNYGTYAMPLAKRKDQLSGLLSLTAPLTVMKGLLVVSSIAVDEGELYTNNIGLYVGVRKVWHKTQLR